MAERLHTIHAEGVELVLDLSVGHIRSLKIEAGGRGLSPLHTAPWVGTAEADAPGETAENVRRLSGDFLCAPFGGNEGDLGPSHGWPANTPWERLDALPHPAGGVTARYRLARTVLGASVEKHLTLRDGHPFVYQRHVFTGGAGRLPVATHAMTRFGPGGGRLFLSPKVFGETPATSLEPDPSRGVFALAYPARFSDPSAVPRADGGTADLTRQPIADRNEDFAAFVEDPASPLGWVAALRTDARDIVFSLKNPAILPVTMLWMSNGGRSYAPWSGRHTGVVGIEEGRSFGGAGHAASIADNAWSAQGIPTALDLNPGGSVEIAHVVGAAAAPDAWPAIVNIRAEPGRLLVEGPGGAVLALPYDDTFLAPDLASRA